MENNLIVLTNEIAKLENDLQQFNVIKKKYDDMKAQLTAAMVEKSIDKLIAPNGTQFTLVKGTEAQDLPVVKFNEAQFKHDHPEMHEEYLYVTHEYKAGRKAYVKITLPKEKANA